MSSAATRLATRSFEIESLVQGRLHPGPPLPHRPPPLPDLAAFGAVARPLYRQLLTRVRELVAMPSATATEPAGRAALEAEVARLQARLAALPPPELPTAEHPHMGAGCLDHALTPAEADFFAENGYLRVVSAAAC